MGKRLVIVAVILFLIITIVIYSISLKKINDYHQSIIHLENTKIINRLSNAESYFKETYNVSKKNVLLLSEIIEADLNNNVPHSIIGLDLIRVLKIDNNYFQARLIAPDGQELIRVEDGGTINISNFQNKKERSYFKEAIQLRKGEVYVSPLNLNIENGKIEIPYRPTVRFFTPVYANAKLIGVVGLNLNVKNWLKHFGKAKNINLLNSKKEIFYGKDEALYTESKLNLDERNKDGYRNYFYKKISFEGNHTWTIYSKSNITSINQKLEAYSEQTIIMASVINLGVLMFLLIAFNLNRKNKRIVLLNQRIKARLTERETLLKEIHHRVKNNLQIVTGLLSLQANTINNQEVIDLFKHSQYRVNSMAIIHEMLYKTNNLANVNYGNYIMELTSSIITNMRGTNKGIELDIKIENVHLNIDTSIPLGLMINEIITNSLKYGFKNTNKGVLTIEIKRQPKAGYLLLIGDNGVGFSDEINFKTVKTLGLKLIHRLALQLKGSVTRDHSKQGTNYIILFQEVGRT